MTFCVATLSTKHGFETKSAPEALALHFTYWFQSRRNQGKVIENVQSFYYLWKQYAENPTTMVERTKSELQEYIKELFPICLVSVQTTSYRNTLTQYVLIIGVRITHENQDYDLTQAILVTGEQYKLIDAERLS